MTASDVELEYEIRCFGTPSTFNQNVQIVVTVVDPAAKIRGGYVRKSFEGRWISGPREVAPYLLQGVALSKGGGLTLYSHDGMSEGATLRNFASFGELVSSKAVDDSLLEQVAREMGEVDAR